MARPLLAGKVAVAGRDLHLALADHADVARSAAAAAGVADDKASVKEGLQHARLQHLGIHLAGGRHGRSDHARRDALALDHLGDGGEILVSAIGAGADKDRIDPGPGHLAHGLDVVRLGRAGDERLQAGDVDLDLLGVLGVGVGVGGRQVVPAGPLPAVSQHLLRGWDQADDAAHLGHHAGQGDAPWQVQRLDRRAVELDGLAQGAAGAQAPHAGQGQVLGGAGRLEFALDRHLHGVRHLEPGLARLVGKGDVLVAHALAKGADGAQDVQVAVGAHKGGARPGQALLQGHVGADAHVHVKDAYALFLGPVAADLLVDGVGDVVGRRHQVKGKKGLAHVIHWRVAIVGPVVLDHVGPAKIAGGARVQSHPDDLACLYLFIRMSLDDLFNDCFAHS